MADLILQHQFCEFEVRRFLVGLNPEITTRIKGFGNIDTLLSELPQAHIAASIQAAMDSYWIAPYRPPGVPDVHTARWSPL